MPFTDIEYSLTKTVAIGSLCGNFFRFQLSKEKLMDWIRPFALIQLACLDTKASCCLTIITPCLGEEAP